VGNTSGVATGGTIDIGTSPSNNPTSVSIVNSNLVADPAGVGGGLSVGGTSIFTSGSLYNVFGTSGGRLLLGNAFTQSLIFGSGTSVLGGGNGLFTYQGNLIYNPQLAPYSGGTLTIIGTIFSPISPISPTLPASPTAGAAALLANPLLSLANALIASSLLNTNFTNINLLPVTGVAGTTSQADATSWVAAATGLFGSSDPSLFAALPLQLTLDQSSLLFVDGYLDQGVLDPSLPGPAPLDRQKRMSTPGLNAGTAAVPGKPVSGDASLQREDRLKMATTGDEAGASSDRDGQNRVMVTDLATPRAEAVFLLGEQSAQTNATTKLGVNPQPGAGPINVLKLQEWLCQVVPYMQQRLQSRR